MILTAYYDDIVFNGMSIMILRMTNYCTMILAYTLAIIDTVAIASIYNIYIY